LKYLYYKDKFIFMQGEYNQKFPTTLRQLLRRAEALPPFVEVRSSGLVEQVALAPRFELWGITKQIRRFP
jgi:hypothetical protein